MIHICHTYKYIHIYLYIEGARHCGFVWLQPQRQLTNCAAALELTSSSRTDGSGRAELELHSSSRSATARAGQLSNRQAGVHTEVRLEDTRVVWLQPLRTDCAHGLCLICQMCVRIQNSCFIPAVLLMFHTTVCVVCHTNRNEGGERSCIRLDGRLDTAYYGLTISDVTKIIRGKTDMET